MFKQQLYKTCKFELEDISHLYAKVYEIADEMLKERDK